MKTAKAFRWMHRWGSILVTLQLGILIVTGIMLQLKKQSDWIQPPSATGVSDELIISFDRILEVAKSVPEAEIKSWSEVERLDVRPAKGMLKVRSHNRWELQIDTKTGELLQVAYRRSDLIESIHVGDYFHDRAVLLVFLPSALILSGVWITGVYIFCRPYISKIRRLKKT